LQAGAHPGTFQACNPSFNTGPDSDQFGKSRTLRGDVLYKSRPRSSQKEEQVKVKSLQAAAASGQHGKRARTPRVAAVRRLEPQRATRVWSLLLPPTFPIDRK
jgi:hypothetical protein